MVEVKKEGGEGRDGEEGKGRACRERWKGKNGGGKVEIEKEGEERRDVEEGKRRAGRAGEKISDGEKRLRKVELLGEKSERWEEGGMRMWRKMRREGRGEGACQVESKERDEGIECKERGSMVIRGRWGRREESRSGRLLKEKKREGSAGIVKKGSAGR